MAVVIALGNATQLAASIAQQLHLELALATCVTFSDGELNVKLEDASRFANEAVIVVHSTCAPVNDNVLSTAFLAHELKNAGARKVIGVLPYFGYGRQEKSRTTGKPGSAQLVAQLMENAGYDALYALELHEPIVQTFVAIPFENVLLRECIAQHIKQTFEDLSELCIIAPDEGARNMADQIAKPLGLSTIVFQKERYASNKTRVIGQTGVCAGKVAIIVDDIIDTGGTAINVCSALKEGGFEKVIGYFVHPVLSGNACERLEESGFDKVFVSNSMPVAHTGKVSEFDVSEVIARQLKDIL